MIPPGLSHDEAYNGITALQVWLEGRRGVFFDIYNGIEPLIIYWEALYFRLFGITPWAMRFVNVGAGMLTIALSGALARRLFAAGGFRRQADFGAVLVALGVCLSFWAIFVSRLTLRAVTLPLLELPALYCLWRGLTGTGGPPGRRLAMLALGGACLGLAMYTYLSSCFLPLVPFLFFAYMALRGQVRRSHWLGMGLFAAAWAAVFAPLAWYYLQHPDVFGRRADQVLTLPLALAGDPGPLATSVARTLGMFSLVGPESSRYGLAGRPVFEPLGALFFHAGLGVAIWRLRRPAGQAAPYALVLIWWLVMLVPAFITGESPHYLRTIGALPPTCVLWALGILWAGRALARLVGGRLRPARSAQWFPRAARWGLALYLAASGGLAARDYFVRWAGDAEVRSIYGAEFTEVADYLENHPPGQLVALSSAYYRDWDRFRLDVQMHHHPPFAAWFDGAQALPLPPAGSGLQPLYIFTRSAPPDPGWLDWLQLETQGTDMAVYRLRPAATLQLDHRLTAVIGSPATGSESGPGLVQLAGYQLQGGAQAGQPLSLLVHWEALQDVPGTPDYAFFAQLRDRRGTTWAQADANGFAVDGWQPGVRVLQALKLNLPPDLPPIEYTLWLGLEDRTTGRPLPVQGGAGASAVALQAVTPAVAATPADAATFAVPNPSALDVAGLFTLRGYSLSTRQVPRGGSLHVSLFWQAQRAPQADYTLAAWLIDGAGGRIELDRHQPLAGEYPTRLWQAGQWVRDRFDLALPAGPAAGPYQLVVAWLAPDGTALPAGGQPDIPLGEVFAADR